LQDESRVSVPSPKTSLISLYDEVNEAEDIFLQSLVDKHGESANLTREEIGWSEKAKTLLQRGSLTIYDNDLLEMNVTIPAYAEFVNADAIVKIGKEIYQFKKDYVRVILDGSESKIQQLKNLTTDIDGIKVYPVTRKRKEITVGRTNANSSCTSTVGRYRLISYDDYVVNYVPGGNCGSGIGLLNYYLTLRSLKKILGTWQNHNTGSMRTESNLTITHTADCSNLPGQPVLINTLYNVTNYARSCAFGNTCYIYLVQNYDAGRCTSESACSSPYYFVSSGLNVLLNDHHGFGKENTNCWFGF